MSQFTGRGVLLLHITEADQQILRAWIRAGTTPQRVARRARIVLLAAEGRSSRTIAQILDVSPRTALLWRRRYQIGGVAALRRDAPGRGRKPRTPVDVIVRVRQLLENPPANGDRWTIRRLAATLGLSRATTHRLVRGVNEAARLKQPFPGRDGKSQGSGHDS